MKRHGRCACGAVKYRVDASPLIVHCCHCSSCQRETGSAFVLNALIEVSQVALLTGELEAVTTPTASGSGQRVMRCATCKVAVWSHYRIAGEGIAFVRVGTLDEPLEPDVHIYTSTKVPWLPLDGTIPVFEGYYRPRETLSDEARRRWQAANA